MNGLLDFTLCMWGYLASTDGYGAFFSVTNSVNNNEILLYKFILYFMTDNSISRRVSFSNLPDNAWNHICLVRNTATATISVYLNGT